MITVKANGVVTGSDYSSKAHAVGGTGIDTGVGSAKDCNKQVVQLVILQTIPKYYATSGNVGQLQEH